MTLETDRRWRDHYDRTASRYDWRELLWSLLLGYSDRRERRKLVARLELTPGQRLLEVSAGTGGNLSLAAGRLGREGRMVGLDISIGMLRRCQRKLAGSIPGVDLVGGDAAHLPFADGAFDAVLHFGAISLFSDKKTALAEMVRVARPGARVVIGDVGLPPRKRGSLRRRLILRVNPRYGHKPPTELIPADAKDLHLSWFMADTCYLIDFVKP